MKTPFHTMLVFFVLCALIGIPLVAATDMPALFGVAAFAIAILMWGTKKLKGGVNG